VALLEERSSGGGSGNGNGSGSGNGRRTTTTTTTKTPPTLRRAPVTLHGINWFGFNTAYGGAEGLWLHNAPDAASDYFAALRQLKALGFNALRLPFRFGDLDAPAAAARGPPLGRCRRLSEWQTRRRATDPLAWRDASGGEALGALPPSAVTAAQVEALLERDVAAARALAAAAAALAEPGLGPEEALRRLEGRHEGLRSALELEADARADPSVTRCNAGLPGRFFEPTPPPQPRPRSGGGGANASSPQQQLQPQPLVLDRYLWAVQAAVAHGFYVTLSYHPTGVGANVADGADGAAGRGTERLAAGAWGPAGFAAAWVALWRRVACLPNYEADLRGRLLLDLMNEPDALGLAWGEPLAPAPAAAAAREAVRAGWAQAPAGVPVGGGGAAMGGPGGGGASSLGVTRVLPSPTAAAAQAAAAVRGAPGGGGGALAARPAGAGAAASAGWAALALTAMQALYAVSAHTAREEQAWGARYSPPASMLGIPPRSPAAAAAAAARAKGAAAPGVATAAAKATPPSRPQPPPPLSGAAAALASATASAEAAAATPPPPHLLLVEGTGQTALGLNWGNGFATDSAVLASRSPPLSDARPFFAALLSLPAALRARVALAPHAYPPTISRGPRDPLTDVTGLVGAPLSKTLDASFGYAMRAPGVCVPSPPLPSSSPLSSPPASSSPSSAPSSSAAGGGGGAGGAAASASPPRPSAPPARCAVFPVILGEFGSRFVEPADLAWLEDAAAWARGARGPGATAGAGADGAPAPLPLAGWMWWAYNANSDDTGGLVRANWQGFDWVKVRYLVDGWGLQPWWRERLQERARAGGGGAAAAAAVGSAAARGAAKAAAGVAAARGGAAVAAA